MKQVLLMFLAVVVLVLALFSFWGSSMAQETEVPIIPVQYSGSGCQIPSEGYAYAYLGISGERLPEVNGAFELSIWEEYQIVTLVREGDLLGDDVYIGVDVNGCWSIYLDKRDFCAEADWYLTFDEDNPEVVYLKLDESSVVGGTPVAPMPIGSGKYVAMQYVEDGLLVTAIIPEIRSLVKILVPAYMPTVVTRDELLDQLLLWDTLNVHAYDPDSVESLLFSQDIATADTVYYALWYVDEDNERLVVLLTNGAIAQAVGLGYSDLPRTPLPCTQLDKFFR